MHTKLPWKIDQHGSVKEHGDTRSLHSVVVNGFAIAGSFGDVEANENTALIVRAVNSHQELVDALQKVISVWNDLYPKTRFDHSQVEEWENFEFREMQDARAALTKAKS